jgi:hypothetical protein
MRVSAEVTYVRSCPDCRDIVSNLALTCISDPSVTSFRLVPGKRHAHDIADGSEALAGLTDATAGQLAAAGDNLEMTELKASDANGLHPDLVVQNINGFDTEMSQ